MGWACFLEVRCVSCNMPVLGTQTMTSRKTPLKGYDVNRRIVTAASANGIGFSQLCNFCGAMDMPTPMHLKTWQHYQKAYSSSACSAASNHFQEAAQHVRKTYPETGLGEPTADGRLDIAVSFDGSWHKRGRTSNNGIATVIELYTGLILDYEVLSKYCKVCNEGPAEDSPEFGDWWAKHESVCQKNCRTSSQAMETEAAVRMFRRSIDLHNFRYIEMLSDGDSKAYTAVCQDSPYGSSHNVCNIEKKECTNHVTKRMGTALRTLVAKQKAVKEPIGGRGRLTDKRIDQLTNYYGRAIKDHAGDLDGMEQAVWATYYHSISTDEDPQHLRCPAGKESWCFYRRAEANNEPPPSHSHPLPREVAIALTPVYTRLGDRKLLERCLPGKTQNANESFHSMVWRCCPKERWAGRRTVEAAVAISCTRYNKGSSALLDVLAQLDLHAGGACEEFVSKSDTLRVQKASRKCSEKAKKRRKTMENAKRRENERRSAAEGETYAPGGF